MAGRGGGDVLVLKLFIKYYSYLPIEVIEKLDIKIRCTLIVDSLKELLLQIISIWL